MAKTRHQRRSKLQESRIAEEVGGKVQAGSGAPWMAKGDVRKLGELRVEAKHTNTVEYRLTLEDILKIRDEALLGGLEPWAMQIEFVSGIGSSYKLAVIDAALFRELSEERSDRRVESYIDSTALKGYKLNIETIRALILSELDDGAHYVMKLTFLANPKPITVAIISWDLFLFLRGNQ